jgi:hypothetical protein
VVDISDPTAPIGVGSYPTSRYANDVEVKGSYAYVATRAAGLRVLDVSNPTAPVEVGFYETAGFAYGVAVLGNYAYVAAGDTGLRVLDVSNPSVPGEVGFYDTPGLSLGVAVSGKYAYVSDELAGLRVVDISDPSAPTEVGFFDSPGFMYGAVVSDSYAYASADSDGLYVLRYALSQTLTPELGGTLVFTDAQGYTTTIQIPPGGVTQTIDLYYAPIANMAPPSGSEVVGQAFELTAYLQGHRLSEFTFAVPVTVTKRYANADLLFVGDETELSLQIWDGATWMDASKMCSTSVPAQLDVENNLIRASICSIGRMALIGPKGGLFLPLVVR